MTAGARAVVDEHQQDSVGQVVLSCKQRPQSGSAPARLRLDAIGSGTSGELGRGSQCLLGSDRDWLTTTAPGRGRRLHPDQ